VKYTDVCTCICGVGDSSARQLETYIFRTVHEMVLKNYAMGKFSEMIPALNFLTASNCILVWRDI